MKLEVVYAYATSRYAIDCGVEKTGGFVVTRGFSRRTGARLSRPVLETEQAFATEADAQAWIEGKSPALESKAAR